MERKRGINELIAHKRELASRLLTLRAKVARYTEQLKEAEEAYKADEKELSERLGKTEEQTND